MKTSCFHRGILTLLALGLSLLVGKTAPATNATASATVASTNVVTQSVFTVPASHTEGCDPFFPTSTRLWASVINTNNTVVQATHETGAKCLVLKGLSGAANNPLAMINGRTMGRGEDAEINTDCGRLQVHCVDITSNSAIVEVSGERRELRLRSDF